jgi:FkbM family methyltransferase
MTPSLLSKPGPGKTIRLSIQQGQGATTLKLFLNPQDFTQKLMLDAFSQGQMYEPEVVQWFPRFLQPGDRVIDIGAHVGYYTMMAALLVGDRGQVLACEMEASNYQRVLYNAALNQFSQVQAFHGAVGDRIQETEFFYNLDNDGGHALWNVGDHPFNTKSRESRFQTSVSMTTLDQLVDQYGFDQLTLLKIDTEGAEHLILQGGLQMLETLRPPFVIVEVNGFGLQQLGSDQMQLRNFMASLGYDSYLLDTQHQLIRLPAHQPYNHGLFNLLFSHRLQF